MTSFHIPIFSDISKIMKYLINMKVIQSLHGFRPLVISGDVEITHSSLIAVRLGGNLMQLRQDPFTSEIYPTSTLRFPEKGKYWLIGFV